MPLILFLIIYFKHLVYITSFPSFFPSLIPFLFFLFPFCISYCLSSLPICIHAFLSSYPILAFLSFTIYWLLSINQSINQPPICGSTTFILHTYLPTYLPSCHPSILYFTAVFELTSLYIFLPHCPQLFLIFLLAPLLQTLVCHFHILSILLYSTLSYKL